MASTFVMAASVLSSEIILTRVFSVLMWYHFAFLAISICLFGLGVGSLALHLFGRRLKEDDLAGHLAWCALGFALSQAACVALLRLLKLGGLEIDLLSLFRMSFVFLVSSVPFGFAGFFLGLVFSRGAQSIDRLYFADLAGAGVGCLLTIVLLNALGGAAALLATALMALMGGLIALPRRSPACRVLLPAAIVVALVLLADYFTGFLIFHHTKGNDEPDPIAVEWNSFSRVIAYHRPEIGDIMMEIDGIAHTPITPFHGDADATQDSQANVQRLPFVFLRRPSVLIIGSGGGEHILTALSAGASKIVGVEMNPIVIDMVERRFADMAGGLFHQPGVSVVHAEGRSFIARSRERYDIINFTLIDTWAATAGGAFSLTENYLFTDRAFHEYFDHLSPRGILALKRWREPPEYPLRLAVLARSVLEERGVREPENCIFLAGDENFVNLMIKPSSFEIDDVRRLNSLCESLGLDIIYSPRMEDLTPSGKSFDDSLFARVIEAPDLGAQLASLDLDYSPPTDDHPFFFYTLRIRDLPKTFSLAWGSKIRNIGSLILFALAAVVSVFVLLLLLVPLLVLRRHRMLLKGNLRAGAYFALIGLGFLTVEISQMQTFILYLGHPTLTLAVFLATLLLAGAVGAALSGRVGQQRPRRALFITTIILIGYALVLGALCPRIFAATLGWSEAARCAITIALISPLGIMMGIPFPMGVRAVRHDDIVPWMFAINSAASVLGSVAAMVIALAFGFAITSATGLAAYFAAALLYPAEET